MATAAWMAAEPSRPDTPPLKHARSVPYFEPPKKYPNALWNLRARWTPNVPEPWRSKMKPVPILILAAFLPLTACGGSSGAGLRLDPLPPAAQQACPAPSSFLSAGDWEILAGRLGDALIACEGRRALAAGAYGGATRAVADE
ncbi:MAG: hypothetical protein HLUCCA12_12250 [Rhodobacteraceae bacterium HLUCCA12]|nr:MAG: hypothetical protein HLUCCA12_12250 [Rhodobacteraceae bacterium HLUCCA12]